jgi:hypothetical protein
MKASYFILILNLFFWALRAFAWFTPNNILQQKGFGHLVAFDFFLSPFFGFSFAVGAMYFKDKCNIKSVYWLNLILGWGLFIIPIFVFLYGFISVVFFGMSV